MSYDATIDSNEKLADLNTLIASALGQDVDVILNTGGGFMSVMGRNNPNIQQDVPAAFEMYSLLMHFLTKAPVVLGPLGGSGPILSPAVHYDPAAGRVVLVMPVGAHELEFVAHWIAESLISGTVKAMAGLLALPFSVEMQDGARHLIPEWFGAFYVGGDEGKCVPVLTLKSVTLDERFADWVAIALQRMKTFELPCEKAQQSMQQKTTH
jgi:hypothetical protein